MKKRMKTLTAAVAAALTFGLVLCPMSRFTGSMMTERKFPCWLRNIP